MRSEDIRKIPTLAETRGEYLYASNKATKIGQADASRFHRYLITLGAAEFLYNAVAQWHYQRFITVDAASLPFFRDLYPTATQQTYHRCNRESDFSRILQEVTTYADSFVVVMQKYTPEDGSLAEQFTRTPPGSPLSARDLTWSYAAFVTMSQRRAGQYPPSWVPVSRTPPPAVCSGTSTPGVYVPAYAAGAPNVTSACTVTVTFVVNATTYFGENIYLIGNTTDLGVWDIENAQPMTAANYSVDRPQWFAEVDMTAGETVSYVYVRSEDCVQGYIYEAVNRTLVIPSCEAGSGGLKIEDSWVGPVGSHGSC